MVFWMSSVLTFFFFLLNDNDNSFYGYEVVYEWKDPEENVDSTFVEVRRVCCIANCRIKRPWKKRILWSFGGENRLFLSPSFGTHSGHYGPPGVERDFFLFFFFLLSSWFLVYSNTPGFPCSPLALAFRILPLNETTRDVALSLLQDIMQPRGGHTPIWTGNILFYPQARNDNYEDIQHSNFISQIFFSYIL